jgi:hypothetical protein
MDVSIVPVFGLVGARYPSSSISIVPVFEVLPDGSLISSFNVLGTTCNIIDSNHEQPTYSISSSVFSYTPEIRKYVGNFSYLIFLPLYVSV